MNPQGSVLVAALALLASFSTFAQTVDPLTNWQAVAASAPGLRGIAHLDGRFVAVGYSNPTNVAISTNGLNWVGVATGVAGSRPDNLYAVDAAMGQFVAVGNPDGIIMNSPDGFQWTRRYGPTEVDFWAITHGNGLFVTIGSALGVNVFVGLSPDGIQWEILPLPQLSFRPWSIAYGNGRFVAVGGPFSITSTNGRDWVAIPSLTGQSVAFGNGRFLAAGGATGHTSTNGLDWTPVFFARPSANNLEYISAGFGNGLFLAGSWSNGSGALAVLGDGEVRMLPPISARIGFAILKLGYIRDVIFVGGRYYLASEGGTIWRTGIVTPVTPPRITRIARENAQTSLTVSTIPGFRYAVEAADAVDATDWQPLTPAAVPATDDELHLIDPQPDKPVRFYRARTE